MRPEWSDRYKGQFDDGWDALRERTLARQKELGVVPADAALTARPAEIPAWDDMPAEMKPVLARQMEVYAGFLEHTDHHVGRLVDALADLERPRRHADLLHRRRQRGLGRGDAERHLQRADDAQRRHDHRDARVHDVEDRPVRDAGGVQPLRGRAGRTRWTRPTSGRSRWPRTGAAPATARSSLARGDPARGEIRSQFSHVIDIAATVLDAAGLPEPTFVHGVQQVPLQGRSMRPSFDDGAAPEHRETQYFEMFVNRGIYHQGWTAVTRHSTPVGDGAAAAARRRLWELYGPDDWTQAHDLAAEQPERLAHLQRLFLIEATKNNVLPLDDRRVERFNSDLAGRPTLVSGNTQLLFGGMGRLSENSVLNIKNKSHAVTAQVVVPEGVVAERRPHLPGRGVRRLGDLRRWMAARPTATTSSGCSVSRSTATPPIPAGDHQVRVEFAYDGGGLAKGGAVTLYLDGTPDRARAGSTPRYPWSFSGDETTDLGFDTATPVSDDYGSDDSRFNGRVRWVQIDLGDDAEDADHLITPEERYRVAMARQ